MTLSDAEWSRFSPVQGVSEQRGVGLVGWEGLLGAEPAGESPRLPRDLAHLALTPSFWHKHMKWPRAKVPRVPLPAVAHPHLPGPVNATVSTFRAATGLK